MFRISLLMILFVVHVFSKSDPISYCKFNISMDISQGTRLFNDDIIFRGEMYEPHEHYYDKETDTQRVCVCAKKICIRKCCPLGQGFGDQKSCTSVNNSFDPPLRDDYEQLKGVEVSRFHLFFDNVECPNAVRAYVSQIPKNLHYLKVRSATSKTHTAFHSDVPIG